MSQSLAPAARKNWRSSSIRSCWGRCRCISVCVKISIAERQPLSSVRKVISRPCIVTWPIGLLRSFTGRGKSFPVRLLFAPSDASSAYLSYFTTGTSGSCGESVSQTDVMQPQVVRGILAVIENLAVVSFDNFTVRIIDQHICAAHVGPVRSGIRCGQIA